MALPTPKSGNKLQLQPLMPEDMRSELIAALKVQNIQNFRPTSINKSGRRFALPGTHSNSPVRTPLARDTDGGSDEQDKRHQLRLQAIREIRTSEQSYLRQLEVLLEYFVTPLRTNGFLTERVHNAVFGQLDTIHNLSQELLKKLDDNLDNVVKAFTNLGPFFKLYSVYAFDYRNSLCTLQSLMDKNPTLKRYINNTEARPEVQTKLISLLITPIQRIPRYRLLLQQVLLYTSPSDEAFKPLQESIRLVEQSVSHINAVVEDYENTQRLILVQNVLSNKQLKLVKPGRKILKEGILGKLKTDGSTSKKYCILMSDMFMYCRMVREVDGLLTESSSLVCSCVFPLKKCKIIELFRGNFRLTCSGDGTIFSSESPEESRAWYTAIKEAIELHVQCRKTLRKLSSNRKPMRKKHLQRLEPEPDDIMWLLRRKTVSPDRVQKPGGRKLWPFKHIDCLKQNQSFGEPSGGYSAARSTIFSTDRVATVVTGTPLPGGSSRQLVVEEAKPATAFLASPPMEEMQRKPPAPVVERETNVDKRVHFRFPSSQWRY
ncbi:guanine nucleotide exchange factor [Anopheles darlingi]|uniref:Guanine nucleotide exchange factor n=1 Tax=Anopheles darlingi TaxID=43151 RepID=W5JM95_ANODA|nr:guanine nucleotide exchange factor [Anopheles darlingi]